MAGLDKLRAIICNLLDYQDKHGGPETGQIDAAVAALNAARATAQGSARCRHRTHVGTPHAATHPCSELIALPCVLAHRPRSNSRDRLSRPSTAVSMHACDPPVGRNQSSHIAPPLISILGPPAFERRGREGTPGVRGGQILGGISCPSSGSEGASVPKVLERGGRERVVAGHSSDCLPPLAGSVRRTPLRPVPACDDLLCAPRRSCT